MKFDDVVAHLDRSGIDYEIHEHEPNLTMEEVEAAGSFDMDAALKTMVFETEGQIIAVVLLGRDRVHYGELAKVCGISRRSLKVMDRSRIETMLGDIPGGVGPIQPPEVTVVVDDAVAVMGRVSVGAGRPDRTLEIDAKDLIVVTGGVVAPIVQAQ